MDFHYRGSAANYTPLGVYIGPNAPSAGYTIGNTTFVSVVTGFWEGHHRRAGEHDPYHRHSPGPRLRPPESSVPAHAAPHVHAARWSPPSLPPGSRAHIPASSPLTGVTFKAPHYGWNVTVLAANSSFVTVENLPYVGYVGSPPAGRFS